MTQLKISDIRSASDFYLPILLNTQYATDSTLVCPVKMEYGPEINIFDLKLMMKSSLEKIF